MHGMGKTIPEPHDMLKLVEKGIPKKNHAVLAIRQGQIQKPKLQARGKGKQRGKGKSKFAYDPKHKIPPPTKKEHPTKDTKCHYCHKIGHRKRNCPLYLEELKKNKASASGTSDNGAISVSKDNICYFNAFPRDGIFKIDMHNHISNERSIYTCSNRKTKHKLDFTFLWHCRLGHINKKRIKKLQHDELLESIDDESFDVCVSCISRKMARNPFTHASERVDDLLGIIHSDVCGPFRTMSREGCFGFCYRDIRSVISEQTLLRLCYAQTQILCNQRRRDSKKSILLSRYYSMKLYGLCRLEIVRNCPYWGLMLLESAATLYSRYGSTKIKTLMKFKSKDAKPSKNTSLHQHEVEHDTIEPQTDVIPIRRSARIPQAPERYGFYIDAKEHELRDHREPPNYQAALSDPESEKWLEAMNAEMQSMKDNQVLNLVDLPFNCKTVRSKWIFKKKTDMDGNMHTYKAHLVAKGFTQTYEVDYEETFSPVADIKAIKILIAIAAYYDYKIWKMDVKTAFLNGRLNKDIYMVQPKGVVNPMHSRRQLNLGSSKRGTILMQPNVDLRKSQGPSTLAEVKRMKGIPYASAVGSIMLTTFLCGPHVKTSCPLPEGWSIRSIVWSIVLGEREENSFLVITLSGKVVEYNLISKILREIYDMGSNKVVDDYLDGFIPPFAIYEWDLKKLII
ncbi:retrotransposon protein, putative, ty1-copia subclass, partial [Tanacetum coccineum]